MLSVNHVNFVRKYSASVMFMIINNFEILEKINDDENRPAKIFESKSI